jgi:hypothetical protein
VIIGLVLFFALRPSEPEAVAESTATATEQQTEGTEGTASPSPSPTETEESRRDTNGFAHVNVGDCIMEPRPGVDSSVEVVECDAPHWGQVFYQHEMSENSYPGEDGVTSVAETECNIRTSAVDGSQASVDPESLQLYFFGPTQLSWDLQDDRTIHCMVIAEGGSLFQGDLMQRS